MKLIKKIFETLHNTYTWVVRKVRTNIQQLLTKFERKPLNLDFNMDDYFSLENRIKENRQYLREIQDKYEKIRNYYPLFFIYVGFIGVYTFDIIQYFLMSNFIPTTFVLGVLLTVHVGLFAYVFYLFSKILILKDIAVDLKPKTIFSHKDNGKKVDDILKGYSNLLEESIEKNYTVLENKKNGLSKVIKFSLISFIVYIALITTYKLIDMRKKKEKQLTQIETGVVNFNLQYLKDNEEKTGNLILENDSTKILENKELKRMKDLIVNPAHNTRYSQ